MASTKLLDDEGVASIKLLDNEGVASIKLLDDEGVASTKLLDDKKVASTKLLDEVLVSTARLTDKLVDEVVVSIKLVTVGPVPSTELLSDDDDKERLEVTGMECILVYKWILLIPSTRSMTELVSLSVK